MFASSSFKGAPFPVFHLVFVFVEFLSEGFHALESYMPVNVDNEPIQLLCAFYYP
jgi:hypothetical protein